MLVCMQGLNTSLFHPEEHQPLPIFNFNATLITGPPAAAAAAMAAAQRASNSVDTSHMHSSGTRPFIFLSIFKWENRKGWDLLFKAYTEEFSANEDVELHIVTHEAFEKVDDWTSYVRKELRRVLNVTDDALDKMPRTWLTAGYIPDSSYPGVYKATDALVIPTHGEGWGRPQIEVRLLGGGMLGVHDAQSQSYSTRDGRPSIRAVGCRDSDGMCSAMGVGWQR